MADSGVPNPSTEASQMADESQASLVSTRDELDHVNTKGIKLDRSAREDILSGINDSSESFSLYGDQDDEQSANTGAAASETPAIAPISTAASGITMPKRGGGGSSKLKQVLDSADMETPKAEKADPLAKKGAQLAVPGGDSVSRATTQDDDRSDALSAGSGKPARPGAMRRLTSRIKRTISSKG